MGLTGLLAVVVSACIIIGFCAKRRVVRLAAWCVAGTLVLAFVLFIFFALPRILPR